MENSNTGCSKHRATECVGLMRDLALYISTSRCEELTSRALKFSSLMDVQWKVYFQGDQPSRMHDFYPAPHSGATSQPANPTIAVQVTYFSFSLFFVLRLANVFVNIFITKQECAKPDGEI